MADRVSHNPIQSDNTEHKRNTGEAASQPRRRAVHVSDRRILDAIRHANRGRHSNFTIDPVGRIVLTPEHVSAFREDPTLGGKSSINVEDFDWAIRRASTEEGGGVRP